MNTVNVKIKYTIPVEKTLEMTIEDFFNLRADFSKMPISIPKSAKNIDVDLASTEDAHKVLDYWYK